MEIKVQSVSITSEVLNAADTTQIVRLFGIPAHSYILHFLGRKRTGFAGVTAPSVIVGYTGGTADIMKSQDLSLAGDLMSGPNQDDKSFCPRLSPMPIKTEASRQIFATFTSSSGNFSALSAGEVEFVVVYVA